MKILLSALLLISVSAQARTVLSTETKKVQVTTLDNFYPECRPGFDGGYKTQSALSLYGLDLIFPDTNIREIGSIDPKGRVGDHCAELKADLQSLIPGEITFVRTRSQEFSNVNGICNQTFEEDLVGTIGDFFFEGAATFAAGQVADTNCQQ